MAQRARRATFHNTGDIMGTASAPCDSGPIMPSRRASIVLNAACNHTNFDERPDAPQAGDLDGRPSRVGLRQVGEADPVEQLEMVTQADMIAGHLDHRAEGQAGFR